MEHSKKSHLSLSAVLAALACLAALLLWVWTAAPSTEEPPQAWEKPAEIHEQSKQWESDEKNVGWIYAATAKKKAKKSVQAPTPIPTPDPTHSEDWLRQCGLDREVTYGDIVSAVIGHADNHDHSFCRQYDNQRLRLRLRWLLRSGADYSGSADLGGLPGSLACEWNAGCSGSCQATFSQLAGQPNVPVRLDLDPLSGGGFNGGRIVVGFPGQQFEVRLSPGP